MRAHRAAVARGEQQRVMPPGVGNCSPCGGTPLRTIPTPCDPPPAPAARAGLTPARVRARPAPRASSTSMIATRSAHGPHQRRVPELGSAGFTTAPRSTSSRTAAGSACAHRGHQRCLARQVCLVRVRVGLEQPPDHGLVAVLRRDIDRRDAVRVVDLDVCARADQHIHRRRIIGPHRPVQRRGPVFRGGVDVNALSQERLDGAAIPVPGGLNEGRHDLGVGRRSRPEQDLSPRRARRKGGTRLDNRVNIATAPVSGSRSRRAVGRHQSPASDGLLHRSS